MLAWKASLAASEYLSLQTTGDLGFPLKAASKATLELVICNFIFWIYLEIDSENIWTHYTEKQYVYNCIKKYIMVCKIHYTV